MACNENIDRCGVTLSMRRFSALREACHSRDFFFVFLHRIMSIWNINRSLVLQELNIPSEIIDAAFQQLQVVLQDGRRLLCHDDLIWFANFPPGEPTREYDDLQTRAIAHLRHFLSSMANAYRGLRQQSMQIKMPILPIQSAASLGCASETLKILIFKESCLMLGCPPGGDLYNMMCLCRQELASESNFSGDNQAVIQQYQEWCNRYSRAMVWMHSPPEATNANRTSNWRQNPPCPPPTAQQTMQQAEPQEEPQANADLQGANSRPNVEPQQPQNMETEQPPPPEGTGEAEHEVTNPVPKQEVLEAPINQITPHPGRLLRTPRPDVDCDFHESLKGFALRPCTVFVENRFLRVSFDVPEDEFSMLATNEGDEGLSYYDNSGRYRLRIVEIDSNRSPTADGIGEVAWMTAKPAELQGLAVSVNGQHITKPLPHDLNRYLQQDTNVIEISMRHAGESVCFGVAVEIIEAQSHDDILDTVSKAPPFSMTEVLARLDELNHTNGTQGSFCVPVVDQQTSKLVRAAVRSTECDHLECFDLDDWLERRLFMAPATNGPHRLSTADDWLCPICNAVALPSYLRPDAFFRKVGEELWRLGNETKQIMLGTDGSWSAVESAPGEAASNTIQ